jgi:hypothetical protein
LVLNPGHGPQTTTEYIEKYMAHAAPVSILTLDFLMNAVHFKSSHVTLLIIIFVIYSAVNYTVTEVRGKPVYKPLDFKTWMTEAYGVIALVGIVGAFFLLKLITHYREKAYYSLWQN